MQLNIRDRDRYFAAQWAHRLIERDDWLVLDTETTGLHNAEIVQIVIISCTGEVLLDSLVKPTIPIPSETTLIHGITDARVENSPGFSEIYSELSSVIENKHLVIYNAKFDTKIIKHCCDIAGLAPPVFSKIDCAMQWYAQWVGDWDEYRCDYRWHKLPGANHTAIGDCNAVLNIIREMSNSFQSEVTAIQKCKKSQSLKNPPIRVENEKSTSKSLNKCRKSEYPKRQEGYRKVGDKCRTNCFYSQFCLNFKKYGIEVCTQSPVSTQDFNRPNPSHQKKEVDSTILAIYKRARAIGLKQQDAAFIAGFSSRTGRRIERQDSLEKPGIVGRPSIVKRYEGEVCQWLNESLESGEGQLKTSAVIDRLREIGYTGGKSAVYELVRQIRPKDKVNPKPFCQCSISKIQWMHCLLQGRINATDLFLDSLNELKDQEKHELLDCILNRPIRYRNRAISILAHLRDISNTVIAEFLLISPQVVANYVDNYKTGGIKKLLDVYKHKKTKKAQNPIYQNKVFEILHSPPSCYGINRTTWKISGIHKIMIEDGLKISKDNIRKIIKDAGYKFRKAKKVLTSKDPQYKEKLQKITQILSKLSPKEKFFSIDEFGPFSIKIQGGKSLVPPGEVRVVPQWQKSKGKLIMTAALELSTNQVTHFYSEKKNTEEMIKLLEILLDKYSEEECIYFSWDAASWHASKRLYEKVDEINSPEYRVERKCPIVKLAPLPSGAQFLNVIESVFSGMARAIIHNSNYQSVEECKDAIDRYFSERNQYFIENPKRAGNKIWGKELVTVEFKESNNCKDPRWR